MVAPEPIEEEPTTAGAWESALRLECSLPEAPTQPEVRDGGEQEACRKEAEEAEKARVAEAEARFAALEESVRAKAALKEEKISLQEAWDQAFSSRDGKEPLPMELLEDENPECEEENVRVATGHRGRLPPLPPSAAAIECHWRLDAQSAKTASLKATASPEPMPETKVVLSTSCDESLRDLVRLAEDPEERLPKQRPASFRQGGRVRKAISSDSSPQKAKSLSGGGAVSSSSRPTTAGDESATTSTFPDSRSTMGRSSSNWRDEWVPGTQLPELPLLRESNSNPSLRTRPAELSSLGSSLPRPSSSSSGAGAHDWKIAPQQNSAANVRREGELPPKPPLPPPPIPASVQNCESPLSAAGVQDLSFALALKRASEKAESRKVTPPALDRHRWSKATRGSTENEVQEMKEESDQPNSLAPQTSPASIQVIDPDKSGFSDLAMSFAHLDDLT
eukprot:TRINITY_DN102871_c0_g1_i1.p1 TRINITY_DN102871_c0_g1~~TRINITY_DN102871_c0_g1_i1.p1  ORF type:complete len:496 (+),score=115.96 TRINITY_DN102871_c0_g1_i1:141-1490(+)